MNDPTTRTLHHALARLRAADPVTSPANSSAAGAEPGFADARAPMARAMLESIMATPQTAPPETEAPRRRFTFGKIAAQTPRRRFAFGAAAAGVVAAVIGLAVLQPWAGDPASAYTVEGRPDGSLAVSFRPEQLRNPARLNAELARAGARTVVMTMVPAGQCGTVPDLDPRFRLLRDPSPEELAEQLAIWPIKYELLGESVLITILPARIPAGETLVFGYLIRSTGEGRVTTVRPAVVRSVPPCLDAPTPPGR